MSQQRRRRQQARMLQQMIAKAEAQKELQRVFQPKRVAMAVRSTFK